ncbi:calmodulin-like protein 4 [Dermatophagoides farinae]|uniref:Calmodulin-like protein 4 n=1 Tax=Dermatophagoides farinae TaxID=6954 RepID=A0A9D4P2U6_DERFA|nr:calmodulin-like protein 4 [Dermatophagoides farinae]
MKTITSSIKKKRNSIDKMNERRTLLKEMFNLFTNKNKYKNNDNNNNNKYSLKDNNDDDNNNTIEVKHIPTLLKTIGISAINNDVDDEMNEIIIEKMITLANNNVNIEFETFYTIINEMIQIYSEKNQIKDVFDNIDLDHDGYITSIDLRVSMRKLGISLNDDEIETMMMQAAAAAAAVAVTPTTHDDHRDGGGTDVSGRQSKHIIHPDDNNNNTAATTTTTTTSVDSFDWQTNKIDLNQFKALCCCNNFEDDDPQSSSSSSSKSKSKLKRMVVVAEEKKSCTQKTQLNRM